MHKITANTLRRAPKPVYKTPTLADALLHLGQHLRANEPVVALTLNLNYAAKHQKAKAGAR